MCLERGCTKVRQHLSGASFAVQVHGDCTTYWARAKMWSRSRQGGLRPQKLPQSFLNHFQKGTEDWTALANSFMWRARNQSPRGKTDLREGAPTKAMWHTLGLDTLLAESMLDPGLLIPFPLLSHPPFFFLYFLPLSSRFLFILLFFIIIIMHKIYINFHV